MFAEAYDKIVDRSRVGVFLQSPDVFKDGASRDRFSFVLDQELKKLCFHQRKANEIVAVMQFEIGKVDHLAVDGVHFTRLNGIRFFSKPFAAAEQSVQAGYKNV